jgi:hypothetical protein
MCIATGSKIFFSPESRCGSGFQKKVLRKKENFLMAPMELGIG